MSISYAGYRTGFPFPIREKNEDGDPIELWDGVTFYEFPSGPTVPSGASDRFLTVISNPWPYPNANDGKAVYTPRPLGFTLQELCLFYWRVKSIKLAFNGFVNEVSGSFSTTWSFYHEGIVFGHKSRPQEDFQTTKMANEAEMILEPHAEFPYESGFSIFSNWVNYEYNYGYYLDPQINSYPYYYNFAYEDQSEWWAQLGNVYLDAEEPIPGYPDNIIGGCSFWVDFWDTLKGADGLYYPSMFLGLAAFKSSLIPVSPPRGAGFSTCDESSGTPGRSFTAQFLGKDLPMFFNAGFDSGWAGGFDGTVTHDIEVSITANEYWPYGGKWNTTTGAPTV